MRDGEEDIPLAHVHIGDRLHGTQTTWSRATCAASCGRALSVATVANMRQNLVFAFLYDALGVTLAAGLLYPFTGMLLSP